MVETRETRKKSNKSKKKKPVWFKILMALLIIILLLVGVVIVYALNVYNDAKETVNGQMHESIESIEKEQGKIKIEDQKPLNILLLGVDKRPGDKGRSDTMMIMTLRPDTEELQIVSVPRDTRTKIIGRGNDDKINHAYAFGGVNMSVATVENLLDIDLDYYVEINMQGLTSLVDAVGGISVDNPIDWTSNGYHYAKGTLNLDSSNILGFVRMRHQDPRGDFGRTERQRLAVQAIIKKGASVSSVGKISDMLTVLGNNMKTNMDFADMKSLFFDYRQVQNNISTYMLQGHGTNIGGIYYYIVPEEELQKVHNMIVDK